MRQKIKVRLQPTVASSSKPTLSNQPTPPRYPVASVAAAEEKEDGAVELTPVRVEHAKKSCDEWTIEECKKAGDKKISESLRVRDMPWKSWATEVGLGGGNLDQSPVGMVSPTSKLADHRFTIQERRDRQSFIYKQYLASANIVSHLKT
jgi:hypothetical protein